LKTFFAGPGGAAEVWRISYPLVLSHMSFTLQTFIDRVFLTWYSSEAVAGAVAGLFLTWGVMGLFIATGEYVTTFVSQYHGAGRPERIGGAVWQGIYFAIFAGLVLAGLSPSAHAVFAWAGHDPAVRVHEVEFARVLLLGGFPIVLMATLSGFFSGRGQTRVVLFVNVLATVVNITLDYLWIFGHLGFPRWGVTGAALSTVISQCVGSLVYLFLMFRPAERAAFRTLAGWRFDRELFGRLLRFGFPSGLHWAIEISAFGLFIVIVGRLGTNQLAATGVAFNLNGLVFVPMLGLGVGLTSIVGRYMGAGKPDLAERATWSAIALSSVYTSVCGLLNDP
jgi:MATE family multidrug resistance protein